MIVEDEMLIADELKHLLEQNGYSVTAIVDNAEDALRSILEDEPSLVIMDIVIEGDMDGIDAANLIRSRFGIPVVFLTAYSENSLYDSARSTQPYGYITKPFNNDQLLRTIDMALHLDALNKEKEQLIVRLEDEVGRRKQTEARFRHLYNSVRAGVVVKNPDGSIIHANETASEIFGMSAKEIRTRTSFDPVWQMVTEDMTFVPGKDHPGMITARTGKPLRGVVRGFFSHDPERLTWLLINTEPVVDQKTGDLVEVILTFIDITDRIETEKVLQAERDRAQSYLELANVMFIGLNDQGEIILVNRQGCEVLGRTQRNILGKNWFDTFIPERLREQIRRVFGRLMAGEIEPVKYFENPVLTASGEERMIAWHNTALRDDDDRIIGILGSGMDITERNKAKEEREAALAESRRREAEVRALLDATYTLLKRDSFASTARRVFDICSELIGSTAGYIALLSGDGSENEVLFLEAGGLPCDVDPELPMPIRGLRAEAYKKGATVYDNDFMHSEWMKYMPGGHVVLENVMFAPLKIENVTVGVMGLANKAGGFTDNDAALAGAFGELCAIALDTSRSREKLEASEQGLREAQRIARVGNWSYDTTTGELTWSDELYRMYGLDPEVTRAGLEHAVGRVHPDDRETAETILRNAIEHAEPYEFEYRVITPEEEVRHIIGIGKVVTDDTGKVTRVYGTSQDITDRKLTEEKIEHLSKFPGENPNPVMRVSREGIILYANEGSRHLLKTWDTAEEGGIPEQWRKVAEEALASGVNTERECPCNSIVYSLSFSPITEAGYVNIYGLDITRLKEAELQLKQLASNLQTAREDERIRIAREIHDEIGQMLTGIKMDISLCEHLVRDNPTGIDEHVESLQELVDSTINTVRRISSELRPTILDDFGLTAALEWYVEQFEKRSGITCSLTLPEPELIPAKEVTITLFRIVQEALTNIARHAEATEAVISLVRERNGLLVEISDNGRGITKQDMAKSGSLGIIGMKERIANLDGAFEIEGRSGKGTNIRVTVPAEQE